MVFFRSWPTSLPPPTLPRSRRSGRPRSGRPGRGSWRRRSRPPSPPRTRAAPPRPWRGRAVKSAPVLRLWMNSRVWKSIARSVRLQVDSPVPAIMPSSPTARVSSRASSLRRGRVRTAPGHPSARISYGAVEERERRPGSRWPRRARRGRRAARGARARRPSRAGRPGSGSRCATISMAPPAGSTRAADPPAAPPPP